MPGMHVYWATLTSYENMPIIREPKMSLADCVDTYLTFYMLPPVDYPGLVKVQNRISTASA